MWQFSKFDKNVIIYEIRFEYMVEFFTDVFLIGGYDNSNIFQDIWRLNLEDMQWRRMNQFLETPVYFHDSAITEV